MPASHPYFALPGPVVLGHRGAAGERPENTLLSFECGLARGAHMLESDVHVTRDAVPVLIHDEVVDRTTDGQGQVGDLSLAELQQLDAGQHFSPDGGRSFPYRGMGLRIPTLAEAFDRFPEARFNLELKEERPGLVENTLALIRERRRGDRTLVTAGENDLMLRLRDERKRTGCEAALGAALSDVVEFVRSAQAGTAPESDSMALQIPADFGGRDLVTPDLIAHAHRHGAQIHVWTINDEAEMERLLALGVDGLVTDFPGRLQALLARRSANAQ